MSRPAINNEKADDLAAKVANSVPMASIDQVAAYQDLRAKAGR